MNMLKASRFWLSFPSLLGLLLGGASVHAQEFQSTMHGDWEVVCAEFGGERQCQMRQGLDLTSEEGTGRVLELALSRLEDGSRLMEVVLPLGLDVRPGIVLQVDERDEFNAPFLTCVQQGCVAGFLVDDATFAAMRAGQLLRIGFRPFNADRVFVVEASLRGFTAASRELR
jgi:invasion protein IalB